jgi:hypothetical protein
MSRPLSLRVLGQPLAIVRLPGGEGLPWWAATSGFLAFTRTTEETSLVCDESCVPEGARVQRGFRALRVEGTLPFHLTGVLQSLVTPLAEVSVPVFVVSTYDTDYVLVSGDDLTRAIETLCKAGHSVTE